MTASPPTSTHADDALRTIILGDHQVPVVSVRTVIVGTGSAGYCAADRLWELGHDDIAIVADKIPAGASRNAGSDKQTYYKLTLSGDDPDSVRAMAETLFSGGPWTATTCWPRRPSAPRPVPRLFKQ